MNLSAKGRSIGRVVVSAATASASTTSAAQAARMALSIVMLSAALSPAGAQTLRGAVQDAVSHAPLAGAVVAVLDSSGSASSRVIAGADGRFVIASAPHAASIRLTRIGYRPREATLPADRSASIELTMDRLPSLLEAIRVSDKELCPGSIDRGAAFLLWEQARAGLLTEVVARETKPTTATTLMYQQTLTASDDRVRQMTTRAKRGTTTRPFTAAAAPSYFAQHGYMVEDRSGARVFSAPDGDVLLDDSFASTHCFRRQSADREHPNQTGIAFAPISSGDRDTLVDVTGVIWLDDATPELRSLDFRYTALEPAAKNARAGGHVEFRTMPNGVSFIERWYLRLPTLQRASATSGNVGESRMPGDAARADPHRRDQRSDVRVSEIMQSGGAILDASWSDGTAWREEPTGVKGKVIEGRGPQPLSNVVVTLAGTSDSTRSDGDGAFILSPIIPGKYTVVFADTSLHDYTSDRTTDHSVDIARGALTESNGQLAQRSDAVAKACRGRAQPGADQALVAGRIVLPAGSTSGMKVHARWLLDSSPAAAHGEQLADIDDRGRFIVCGVGRDRDVELSLQSDAQAYTDTAFHLPNSTLLSVDWHPKARAVAAANAGAPASFTGTILRGGTNSPIEGAQIALLGRNRSTVSRADGTFEIGDIPSGDYVVQVRHVGEDATSLTIHLAPGQRLQHAFELQRSVAQLDTVRTTAAPHQSVSAHMAGFERRRASGLGHFVVDSIIRKSENRTVANMLATYIPGLSIFRGAVGGTYAYAARDVTHKVVPPTFGDMLHPNCYVSVYFDGTRLYDASIPNSPGLNLNNYNLVDLAGIEFYSGNAQTPAEYSGGPCGVLLVWTRDR